MLPKSMRAELEAALDRNCETKGGAIIDYVCGKKSRGGVVRKRDLLLEKVIELAFEAVQEQEQAQERKQDLVREKRTLEEALAEVKKEERAPPKRRVDESAEEYAKRRRESQNDAQEIRTLRTRIVELNRELKRLGEKEKYLEDELVPRLIYELYRIEQVTRELENNAQGEG